MATVTSDNLVKRLLVVDDEEGPRQSLNMIFCDDYDVSMASSGEEAVEMSKEEPFHVVITDIRMRGLSGIDVLREVKQIESHTEVIVLTAYETLETARQAISLGASEYLKKPFDLDHIQKVVERCYDHYLFNTQQEALVRKDVNAAKTNFLEIVSHELNTPMNGIIGFIELLQDTQLDEEQADYIETIHDCSLKYFEHVQDILTYAKVTMSDSELSHSSFNPATLLLKQLKEVTIPYGVELQSAISEDLPEVVSGAEQEVRIIFRKLIFNAVKFTESGSVKVSLSCEPKSREEHQFIFVVSDTGPGIDPELVKSGKLFDGFTQADSTLKRAHGGLGLGLSLCKQLSDRLGGSIEVESQPGEGSTFTLKFPLVGERT